jgi:putative restriction endonuclease
MPDRQFGEIEGVEASAQFDTRESLSTAGVHRPTQAGISGSEKEGSDSIVLSGGYEDDEDLGDLIVYELEAIPGRGRGPDN